MSLEDQLFFVGIDWATAEHAVCVLDQAGKKVAAFTVAGFARLGKLAPAGQVPAAIERPDGRLVDVLLETGHPVLPVKPTAIKSWRENEVPSGAKSDPGDAAVIADYPRVRIHRLRPAAPLPGHTHAPRTVVRPRSDLVGAQVAALLDTHWPGAKAIFANIEPAIALAFLAACPTAVSAAGLTEKRPAAFCSQEGYSGKKPAAVLPARLRTAPAGTLDPVASEGIRAAVLAQVGELTTFNARIKDLDRATTERMNAHPDGQVFRFFPRVGTINAAQILAEWGDARAVFDRPDAIAALAGITPVINASGKHRSVSFRWACDKRVRMAITAFAANSRFSSPWAVRILARAWVRVMRRCWQAGTPYDPARHGGAQHLVTQPAAA